MSNRTQNLVIGPILGAIFLGLFFIPTVRRIITGTTPPTETGPAGEWVGTGRITEFYDPKLWGETPGPHKSGALKFTLSQYNGFMDRYAGLGEIFIAGEAAPRKIMIEDFRFRPDGTINISMSLPPDDYDTFDGTLTPNELAWTDHHTSFIASAVLHRGSDADYQALVQNQH